MSPVKKKKMLMPTRVRPMLCTLVKSIPQDPSYIFEVKWDGYRLIAFASRDKARLDSRSGLDYSAKYPIIIDALKELNADVILDGEAVVMNDAGQPDFDELQRYNGKRTPIYYYAFDILWLNGKSLKDLPLFERKKILRKLIAKSKVIKYSDEFVNGEELFEKMLALDMEGIVAKRKDSTYMEGARNNEWLKIPTEKKQEFVIGGWVESESGRPFASLLFGAYNGKKFDWIGHAGGGFKHTEMKEILEKLRAIEIKKSPFSNEVDYDGVAHWVRPKLVANFKFATWTRSGKIRKPAIFQGFRKDKNALQVVREVPQEIKKEGAGKKNTSRLPKLSPGSNWKKIESEKITSEEDFDLPNCSIRINNVEKKLWKDVTKADLIHYYFKISDVLLPYLKDRPQSLHIKPVNAKAPGFYIKDMEGRQPECASIFRDKRRHKAAGKRNIIDYLICNNTETLLFMVNLGCIDINPWTSTIEIPESPDYLIIDLDPSDDDFNKAIETAQAAHEYFRKNKLTSFVKTSGKTGIHLYLPCRGFDFKTARGIAEHICSEIHALVPEITTTSVNIRSRGKRLYLDPNQNDYADTVAAPYSARPFHSPTVSTPLEWKEVKTGLTPENFTIHNIIRRIEKKGDLFTDVTDQKIKIKNSKLLRKL